MTYLNKRTFEDQCLIIEVKKIFALINDCENIAYGKNL